MKFWKLVGTGNDFIFIDVRQNPLSLASRKGLVQTLCDRHWGIGADGVVFVEDNSGNSAVPIKWDFYNSDGSSAEMCGNAARCMGLWASRHLNQGELAFLTRAGVVRAEANGNMVSVRLDFMQLEPKPVAFESRKGHQIAYLINTGVPHFVVEVSQPPVELKLSLEQEEAITCLRFHPEAGVSGANVTFLHRADEQRFSSVTFERGVEGLTLSCGTGVLAAAAVGLGGSPHTKAIVQTPGGELHVKILNSREMMLSGPVQESFSGEWMERS
jgi:diaminopimelate epimerase